MNDSRSTYHPNIETTIRLLGLVFSFGSIIAVSIQAACFLSDTPMSAKSAEVMRFVEVFQIVLFAWNYAMAPCVFQTGPEAQKKAG